MERWGLRARTSVIAVLSLLALIPGVAARAADPRGVHVGLVRASSGLSSPVAIAFSPDTTGRAFIVEQNGRIRVRTPNSGLLSHAYLDIRSRVESGGERGLLGLAFHPSFKTNGFFYVDYTRGGGDIVIARYHASPTSNVASASEGRLLIIGHSEFANHNGGQLQFGPDGFLYIAVGDGGSGGDPHGHAQSTNTLLGKILRIDVNHKCGGLAYCIPTNNPFAGRSGHRGEIFHYGLRNPWRFSFDRANGAMYAGDVGQDSKEEVDAVPAGAIGRNFGWDCREGTSPYQMSNSYCSGRSFNGPAYNYSHSGGRCVIIGGYVYRGKIFANSLGGLYLFADFCTGELFGLGKTSGGSWVVSRLKGGGPPITSFGQSPGGELYVCDYNGGYYHITGWR